MSIRIQRYIQQKVQGVFQSIFLTVLVMSAFGPTAQAQEENSMVLEEVIVTATKRATVAQDTPISLTAMTEDFMEQAGILTVTELSDAVPGLNIVDNGAGNSLVEIRGVAAGATSVQSGPTVGIYIDEMTGSTSGGTAPDAALFDVERVEVLRGPQGTLFGDGSLSGTIRIVTNKPDSTDFYGRATGQVGSTKDGGTNYGIRAMVNIPLAEDKLALRIVAGYRENDGWYDNINPNFLGGDPKNTNSEEVVDIRAALRWTPMDNLTADLVYYHSDADLQDSFFGNTQTTKDSFIYEPRTSDDDAVSLTLIYDIGDVEIVSATGLYEQDLVRRRDATNLGVPINLFFLGRLIDAGWADSTLNNEVFSQEIRISSSGDNVIDWTIGGYYRKDDRDWTFKLDGEPPAPFDILEDYFIIDNKSWAVFGEATWHINDQWELLGGLRYFDTSRSSDFEIWGVLAGPPLGVQSASASEDVVSPKLALTYFPSDDVTLYAQISKGFRAGGANATAPLIPLFNGGATIDDSFDSEVLWNYELGAKSFLFNRRMMLNAYLFLMEWEDRQVAAIAGSGLVDFVVNAGDAESVGIEVEATLNLTDELQLQGSLTFLDTEFKDDVANPVTGFPLTIKGNELPRAADFSAYIALNYVRDLSSGLEGMFNINYTYAGKNFSDAQNIPLFENDSGNILNLRVGIQGEKFGVFLFGQNLTNDDQTFTQGIRDSGAAFGWPTAIAGNYRRPLTYGIEASFWF